MGLFGIVKNKVQRTTAVDTTLDPNTDNVILCDTSAGFPINVTLPAGVDGQEFIVKVTSDQNGVTFTLNGADTLDPFIIPPLTNAQTAQLRFQASTSTWWKIN